MTHSTLMSSAPTFECSKYLTIFPKISIIFYYMFGLANGVLLLFIYVHESVLYIEDEYVDYSSAEENE